VKIIVKLGPPLSQVVGESKAILAMSEGASVGDVLHELRTRYPHFDAGLKGQGLHRPADRILYSLFLNANYVSFEDAGNVEIHDGDRIFLFLPIAGG
jgi:molybdopterin converting factor small subunit